MHASDVWIEKLATFISQRCALYCLPAVFQRCRRRRRLPPVHRLPVCHLQAILDMNNVANSAAIFYHCRRERCLSDQWPYRRFLSEPGSARYSSTPSLITVWSNYPSIHPSIHGWLSIKLSDFIQRLLWSLLYIIKPVTLSPNVQTVLSD